MRICLALLVTLISSVTLVDRSIAADGHTDRFAMAEGEPDISNAKAMDPNIVKEFASYGVN